MSRGGPSESQPCRQLPVHTVSESEWNEFATIARLDHDGDELVGSLNPASSCFHSAHLPIGYINTEE